MKNYLQMELSETFNDKKVTFYFVHLLYQNPMVGERGQHKMDDVQGWRGLTCHRWNLFDFFCVLLVDGLGNVLSFQQIGNCFEHEKEIFQVSKTDK